MKKVLVLTCLGVFLMVFCGAPPETGTSDVGTEKSEDVAYTTLSEVELQKFIKTFPVFKAEVEKKGEKWDRMSEDENMMSWLQKYSEANKDIAELDAKLRASGMSWKEFWPAMMKTAIAMSAVMMDSMRTVMKKEMSDKGGEIAKLEARLKDPKVSEQEKTMIKASLEMMKGMEEALAAQDTVFARVPQVNKDAVKKHWNALAKLFNIEE